MTASQACNLNNNKHALSYSTSDMEVILWKNLHNILLRALQYLANHSPS